MILVYSFLHTPRIKQIILVYHTGNEVKEFYQFHCFLHVFSKTNSVEQEKVSVFYNRQKVPKTMVAYILSLASKSSYIGIMQV